MCVITVLGLPGFAFKDSALLLTWQVDDGVIAVHVLTTHPLCTHVKQLPWKLLFAEPDVLHASLSALWLPFCLPFCLCSWPLTHRGHMASSCAGASGRQLSPSLWALPLAHHKLSTGPGQNSALGSFNSLFFPQAASVLTPSCPQLAPPNPPPPNLKSGKHLMLEFTVSNGW